MTKDRTRASEHPNLATAAQTQIRFGQGKPRKTRRQRDREFGIERAIHRTPPLTDVPLAPEEFDKRLRRLQDLQEQAGGAVLTFAVEYAALYDAVERQTTRIAALHKALRLTDRAATRLRTIAASASALKPIQDRIPLALDVLYELTLAHKEDPTLVQAAVHAGQIERNFTLRDVRDFRRLTQANARDELDALRRIEHPDAAQQQRRAELESLNRKPRGANKARPRLKPTVAEFLRWLSTLVPPKAVMHSFADPAVTIDAQPYGTTVIVERFVMSTVTPYVATDGEVHLPVRDDPKHPEKVTGMVRMQKIPIPPDVLAAIRAAYSLESDDGSA